MVAGFSYAGGSSKPGRPGMCPAPAGAVQLVANKAARVSDTVTTPPLSAESATRDLLAQSGSVAGPGMQAPRKPATPRGRHPTANRARVIGQKTAGPTRSSRT
jgi:hypothetical protein